MVENIPPRFLRALDALAVEPPDRLLEIGCGHGVLLSLVAENLQGGKITAIDRSAKMTDVASRRNAAHIAAGRAEIVTTELADANLGSAKFDKIFAVRVNVFWMQPARELAAVRSLLKPGGAIYLFPDPPSAAQIPSIAAKLMANLHANGFVVKRGMTDASVVAEVA